MIEIGSFKIDLEMRTLQRNGEVVRLGSRAFDILAVVASAGGRLVTKDELMDAVWPDTIVEENNIQVHLSALRKILGLDRDLILTVPGRGYQLLQRQASAPPGLTRSQPHCGRPLPQSKSGLLGRAAEVDLIRSMLQHAHVVTLVGAGGIGKTRLAVEAARGAAAAFTEPVCFVELAALTTQDAVLCAIGESCGLPLPGGQIDVARIAAKVAGQHKLLLLDNAEHVVGAVAQIVDTLVAGNDTLRVLVTSREPLRIMAESVFRVDPLDVPPPEATADEILRCSAVNLFLLRANSLQGTATTDIAETQLIGEICRRLDGIPLAIELAAARVVTLGVEGVCRRLDDRMAILAGGYRTALPRHQTLRATFDWSFALLDAGTKSVFRRLAIFSGKFSFEAMCAVACDQEHTMASAIGGITELAAKSLVSVEFEGSVAKYRLSESTRAYALEKLRAEGELREVISRNARYLSRCFESQSGSDNQNGQNDAGSPPDLQQTIDEARTTLDWAFSDDGDSRVGVELASHLVDALLDARLFEECCMRARQALAAMATLPAESVVALSETRLRAALAATLPPVRAQRSRASEPARKQVVPPRESHAPTAASAAPSAHFATT
jgi:predicted ATPase/DNA-binding winged helix-turn-helix (wHTH) protein